MRFSLFDKKRLTRKKPAVPATDVQDTVIATEDGVPLSVDGREPLRRPGKMTVKDEQQVYHANPSIVDYLPWAEFLDREQCILLDDGVSVGAVFDITPVATEGRTDDRLEQMRDTVEDALQDSFDEHDENPGSCSSFARTRTTSMRTLTG